MINELIYDKLSTLGITPRYKGYNQGALAIQLAVEDENRLTSVTKEIYWEVADSLGCGRGSIERNIRTISRRAWTNNRRALNQIANRELSAPPSASEFIAICAIHVRRCTVVH